MALFWKSRTRHTSLVAGQDRGGEGITCIDINYLTLEPRRVLSADFTLIGGVLELDAFSQTADENLTIAQSGDFYRFELDEGSWSGIDNSFLTGNNASTLTVDSNFLTDVLISDSQSIALDVEFRGVDFSNLDSASVVTSGNIDQSVFFSITTSTLHLAGNEIELDDPANDFGSVSIDATSASITDVNQIELLTADIVDNLELHSAGIALTGTVTADQILLDSSQGLTQTASSAIFANDVMLTGIGDFALDSQLNDISNFGGSVTGNIEIDVVNGLMINNLNISGNLDIALANGDITQDANASLFVEGDAIFTVDEGNIFLNGSDNNFDTISVLAADDVEIADVNNVSIRNLDFSGEGAIIAGQTSTGKITLGGSVSAGNRLLLMASDGVEQISGSVTTGSLILDGSGDFHLCLNNSIGSATSPGRVSAEVSGDLNINNRHAVELVNQNFTTLSGVMISQSQFNVDGSLSITAGANNQNAIFDSTRINVGAEASFESTGNNGDIVLNELDVFGPIGVSTADGDATLINQNANGIVFRDSDMPGVSAVEACGFFERSIVNGNLIAQATQGDISNEATATLEVNGIATLVAGTSSPTNVTGANNEFDIVLGTAADDNVRIDVLSASANQASIELDRSVKFANTAIGNPTSTDTSGGTLFLTVDGSVTLDAGVLLSADNVAIDATQHLFLSDIDADQVAFRAGGFVDASDLSTSPTDLPDDSGDQFAPRHSTIDSEYGIIVSSQNDLNFTTVSDALSQQQNLTGITSENGHAFVQTSGDANIHFDGRGNSDTFGTGGTNFGMASDMQNGHVLTTIAGGDLTIAENTVLRSTSGAVTDISSFTTDEGRDFENVTNEGPFFSLFLPTPSDDPTTRTVNTDDTQFIGLSFGRTNELNFIVEVTWADGTLDILNFDSDIGNRFERISHTFTNQFLTENFELPTFLDFFNDPAINLFDNNGQTDLNTNDNFVLAFSDSRPQGDLQIASVSRPDAIIRESIIPSNDEQLTSETEVSELGNTDTVEDDEVSDAYLVRLDEGGLENEETRQDLENSSVTQDVVTELKRKVEEGTQYPPGQYRLNWTESGVSFSIEFEKGAQEDLELNELNPVADELPKDSGNPVLPGPDSDGEDVEDLSPTSINNVQSVLQVAEMRGEGFETAVRNVEQPSRAGLIAAGALALGLKRRKATGDGDIAEELSKLAITEGKFSFLKSARFGRKVGDQNGEA